MENKKRSYDGVFTSEDKAELVKEFLQTGKIYPTALEIHPSDLCNLRCLYCIKHFLKNDSEKMIPLSKWGEIIDDAVRLGVKSITISGDAEPAFYPKRLMFMVNRIKKYNVFTNMITNGTLLKKEHIRDLVKVGWDNIVISFDTPYQETFEYLRGPKGSFKRVKKTLINIYKYKKEFKSNKPYVTIQPVITNKNYKQVIDLVRFAHEVRANEIFIQHLGDCGLNIDYLSLTQEQMLEFKTELEKAKTLAKEYCINNNFDFHINKIAESSQKMSLGQEKRDTPNKCHFALFNLFVDASGKVYSCYKQGPDHAKWIESIKERSLIEIWTGKKFKGFREKCVKGLLPQSCKFCPAPRLMENLELIQILEQPKGCCNGR